MAKHHPKVQAVLDKAAAPLPKAPAPAKGKMPPALAAYLARKKAAKGK